jgi:L-ascorbate metabolism protein UlaG (beta-lactamase superfamily)
MKFIWLGHASFRIEVGTAVLLLDPWFNGNPLFPAGRRDEALSGASHVVITHAHFDHAGDAAAICKELGVPLVGIYDLVTWMSDEHGIEGIGFNKGGTVDLGGARLTMVNAAHSSSMPSARGPIYGGHESGYMLSGDGHTAYISGDTDIMADMEWMGELHQPDIGVLCAGGHFTMDMQRAAFAARKYFNFKTIIPSHYRTFGLLAQDASLLRAALPGVEIREPEVLQPIIFD